MVRRVTFFVVVGAVLCLVLTASTVQAQTPVKVGETFTYSATTPHPYPVGDESRPAVWTDVVKSPGATFTRIHFSEFNLAPGDYVTIRGGGEEHRYEGTGPRGTGEFWGFSTDGDIAIVQLHGGRAMGHGYTIDKIGHGTLPAAVLEEPTPEVICGTDGRKAVACYTSPPKSTWNPVARLLYTDDGGGLFVCTGSLVRGSNASTLITNNHCIDSQTETNSLQARFNYQKKNCNGNQQDPASNYNGGTLLRTSPLCGGLDYTLVTLLGNPEGAWGEFIPTSLQPAATNTMFFPQHPGGGLKKLGKFEDKQQLILCDVTAVGLTFNPAGCGQSTTPNSQFSYGCDSEGGSSGSPILKGDASKVWGLHHLANVSFPSCDNGGTLMSFICSNAGSLLQCDSN